MNTADRYSETPPADRHPRVGRDRRLPHLRRGRSPFSYTVGLTDTSANKRRTRHDRWAINGQDWRIRDDLARHAA
jgi:hypothetical protein